MAILCIGIEFCLRVKGLYSVKFYLIRESGWNRDLVNLKNGISTQLVPSSNPGLGWELKKIELINSYGRFKKGKQLKPKVVFRIIALGDSVTQMGYYEKFLEDRLNAAGFNYYFEVWNCGTSGYNITNYYFYLKEKVLNFYPDLIFLNFTLNDFSGDTNIMIFTGKKYLEFSNPFAVVNFPYSSYLFLHSHLYRFIISKLEKSILNNKDLNLIPVKRLNGIIDICHKNRIKIIALIWPYLKNNYSKDENQVYYTMKTILDSKKIPYIDLHESFIDRDDPSLRLYIHDYIHPSQKAFEIMTPYIYNFVISYLKDQRILEDY